MERAWKGEEIIIAKAGNPMTKLLPHTPTGEPRRPGALKGKIVIHDDFDELPEEILAAFEGRSD